jgi:hypothetical protein
MHQGLYSGAWRRDLRADLEVIQAFGATSLVTLMECAELDEVGVPASLLGSSAKEFGLEWHHLPIKDVHAPDERFEDLWAYSGLRLRSALARGEKIVVHCRGAAESALAGKPFGPTRSSATVAALVRSEYWGAFRVACRASRIAAYGGKYLKRLGNLSKGMSGTAGARTRDLRRDRFAFRPN